MLGIAQNAQLAGWTRNIPVVATSAVAFDGTGDYYSAAGLTTTATDNKYLTLAFTFYLNSSLSTGLWALVAGNFGPASPGAKINLSFQAVLQSTSLHMWFANGSGSDIGQTYGGYTITGLNAWHQIVYYQDSTSFANCKYYVDGVDQTGLLQNGPSFGQLGIANTDFNWGYTNSQVLIGNASTLPNTGFYSGANDFLGNFAQIYIHNNNSAPTISNYWNSTSNLPRDLGTTGTATGLAQPLIYHSGGTSTFPTNNGTGFNAYTLTASGTPTTVTGPTYGT